jgi:integrase
MDQLQHGRDPGEAKKTARAKAAAAAADTVQAICNEYMAREGKKLRSAKAREASLQRLIYPAIGERPIASITRTEIIRLIDRVEDKRGAPMADMAQAILSKIFHWHEGRSDEFRSPIVRAMGKRTPQEERARSRVLSDDELRRVWRTASEGGGPFPAIVKLLLLTGARRNEVSEMRHEEINGTDWTLPASRNKTKVDLVRPLSAAALAVIEAQPRIDGCPFVFAAGTRPFASMARAKRNFDAACGVTDWRLHDLRRTSRTLLSRAGVNSDHAERCLGHVIGGVRGVYDRHEFHNEKRRAFERLADMIARIVSPPARQCPSVAGLAMRAPGDDALSDEACAETIVEELCGRPARCRRAGDGRASRGRGRTGVGACRHQRGSLAAHL